MLGPVDTVEVRKFSYAESNTNTVSIILNAIQGEKYVIDKVLWSIDSVPSANTSHVSFIDVTAGNAIILEFDLTAKGHELLDVSPLVFNTSASVQVKLLAESPGVDHHLAIWYR